MKRLQLCIVLTAFTLWFASCSSESSTTTDNETTDKVTKPNGTGNEKQQEGNNNGPVNSTASNFETFFNESLVGRNSGNIEDALKAIIHPEMGVFLIHKPGAIERPTFCKGTEDLKAIRASIIDEFTAIKSNTQTTGELPFYDCDTFDKNGTYHKSGPNAGVLVSTYHDMEEMLSMEVDPEEMQAAQKADEATSTDLVSTEAFLQLGFGQVDGKWYLFSIDIAAFDCGA